MLTVMVALIKREEGGSLQVVRGAQPEKLPYGLQALGSGCRGESPGGSLNCSIQP